MSWLTSWKMLLQLIDLSSDPLFTITATANRICSLTYFCRLRGKRKNAERFQSKIRYKTYTWQIGGFRSHALMQTVLHTYLGLCKTQVRRNVLRDSMLFFSRRIHSLTTASMMAVAAWNNTQSTLLVSVEEKVQNNMNYTITILLEPQKQHFAVFVCPIF